MNFRRWLTLVVGGVLGIARIAMAQDTPWHYDFEELSPAYQADANSQLSLSTKHYKLGRQSLKWRWQNDGHLVFTDPAPERKTELEGFRAWAYNEQALEDATLTFRFGTESELATDNPRYQFEFGLNFTGWRAMWIDLREDARNDAYTGPRNGRVTAFEINATSVLDSVYLDVMEMVDRVRRTSADAQVPFIADGQTREYRWSLNTLPGDIPAEISEKEEEAFKTISDRYETWVLGDNVNADQRLPVQIRLDELEAYIQRGYRNLGQYEIRRENDQIVGTPLFASGSPYKPYFESFFAGVLLRLVLDYRLDITPTPDAEKKKQILDLFDHINDQGWAASSGIGTLHHEFLRMAGYAHAVYLMREELDNTSRLEREAATMAWHSLFGEVYEETWDPGTNADFMRSVALYRLLYILMLDDDTPEKVTTKVATMHRYVAWLNNALDIAPGWLDTIKPDYSGFHHRGIYANAYAPNGFHVASLLVYLLHDTPFAVAPDKRENLRQALLTARVMANTYDISTAINGRFPFNTKLGQKVLQACMYLALSYDPVDAQLGGVFMQLWKPESSILKEELFERVSVGIMYLDTPGAMQMMVDFAQRNYAPEAAPSGHWTLPYGALSIHRREEWMVSMKGWSKYVWDFEATASNNPLGRYLSYGSMLIYAKGEPVSREVSGIVQAGWDWSMWPGTTAIRLSHDVLNQWTRDRNFSDETFVGGVNLEGQNGVFALKLHDTEHNTSFRAVKTVFCFDEVLVCLGSGIENDEGAHSTATSLFQTSISENHPTVVNGDGVLAIPYDFSGTTNQIAWMMDASGNGYVVPDGGGLRVQRRVQAPGDFGREGGGMGTFELAYLDHGRAPQDKSYHYAVLVQQPLWRVRKFANAPEYVVWQRDHRAHIVHHPGLKATGYALFDVGARPAKGPIVSVDLPSLAMTREVEDGLLLSVSDPDYGWNWQIQTPHRQDGTLIVNQPSVPRTLRVTVQGSWRLDGMYDLAQVTSVQSDQTVVAFTCQDGKTVQVKLVREGVDLALLDFDEDNEVGIGDFLLLVSHFGLSENDMGFDSTYDLDDNGTVGFSDFLIFTEGFGKRVNTKPVAL